MTRKTSFEGFLPKYPFNVVHTAELYPEDMREDDAELDVDKAMTILVVGEDQMRSIINAYPFDAEDLGFKETSYAMYERKDNPDYKLLYNPCEQDTNRYTAVIPQEDGTFSQTLVSLPNHTVASVVLRSIGLVPMITEAVKESDDTVEFQMVEGPTKETAPEQ